MKKRISATDLAKMGKCERLVRLDITNPTEQPAWLREAAERGNQAHARFEKQALADKRCFVASWAFGMEAPETQALRAFRDKRLLTHQLGVIATRAYYRFSPWLIAALAPIPGARHAARWILRGVLRALD